MCWFLRRYFAVVMVLSSVGLTDLCVLPSTRAPSNYLFLLLDASFVFVLQLLSHASMTRI